MAGFATLQAAIDAYGDTVGKTYAKPWHKASFGSISTAWRSLWLTGGLPGAGTNPAATPGTAYTDGAGGITFPNTSTETKHMTHYTVLSNVAVSNEHSYMIYDRLVGVSGISLTSTGNKTINSVALPRYSGTAAENVEVWLEVTTSGSTTACQLSMNSYTNEAGTAGRAGSTFVFPIATPAATALYGPMPLQAGDKGVRSVEVGLDVSVAATALVVNVLLIRRLAILPIAQGRSNEVEYLGELLAPIRIFDGATIGVAVYVSSANTMSASGLLQVAYG